MVCPGDQFLRGAPAEASEGRLAARATLQLTSARGAGQAGARTRWVGQGEETEGLTG